MNTRYAILLAALLGLCVPGAQAVQLSTDNTGEILIYPYYTVKSADGNAFNTYLTIVNTDANAGKLLRVRMRTGRDGSEAGAFNLHLEPGMTWAAALVPAGPGAQLITRDTPCTVPPFLASTGGVRFTNLGGGVPVSTTTEGWVEVFEMASYAPGSVTCADVPADRVGQLRAPAGGLSGTLTLINVQSGMDFTLNAEAISEFATAAYYRAAADPYPDYNVAEGSRVASFSANGKQYRATLPSALGAVEAVLARRSMLNEVVLDPATASATDWIVTLPTRRLHSGATPSPWFAALLANNTALRLGGTWRARNAANAWTLTPNCGFLCPPFNAERDVNAPHSATVFTFIAGNSSSITTTPPPGTPTGVLGSTNSVPVSLPDVGAGGALELGWVNTFNGVISATIDASSTRVADNGVATERIAVSGLPMVGFMVRTLKNGTLACTSGACQGNYGGSTPHRYRRVITP